METIIYGNIKNKENQKQLIKNLRDIPHLCGNIIRDESIEVIEECADLLEILLEIKPVRKPENFWGD